MIKVQSLTENNSVSIQDRYNSNKVWRISKSKSRHYYMEQFICGKRFGKKVRTTLKHINSIFE